MNAIRKNRGSFLVTSIIISVALMVIIVSMAKTFKANQHQAVYMDARNDTYRLAETGLNDAIGKLVINKNAYKDAAFDDPIPAVPAGAKYYESYMHTATTSKVVQGGFYIVTSASKCVNGRLYHTMLHSHVAISNASDYFWAVKNRLALACGVDASQGRVYAGTLVFNPEPTDGSNPGCVSRVRSAEYTTDVDPDPESTRYDAGGNIVINGTPGKKPEELSSEILFPQILDTDMTRFREAAYMSDNAKKHAVCDFTNFLEIYPPGYTGATADGGDYYGTAAVYNPSHHSDRDADHVYFCEGDMRIRGTVHGQVLFVATGTIFITGNLTIFNDPNNQPGTDGTSASSSTAHQAVLITRGNVEITADYRTDPTAPGQTQTIDAFILAPHGRMSAIGYPPPPPLTAGYHNMLRLDFTGAIVVSEMMNDPGGSGQPSNLGTVFQLNNGINPPRTYTFMNSLQTNPPPYIPALIDIRYSFEVVDDAVSLY